MKIFGGGRRRPGWLCINLMPDRIDLSHVLARGRARPELLLCESFRNEGDELTALRRLRRELQLDRYYCTTLLKPGEYEIHQIEAPDAPPTQMREAVRRQLQGLLAFPAEDASVDSVRIPSSRTGPGQPMLAVAARTETIARALKPFHDAEIDIHAVDIPELAQRNVGKLWEEGEDAHAVVCFGETGGFVTIDAGGELYCARQLDISLGDFTEAPEAEGRGLFARVGLYERVTAEVRAALTQFGQQSQQLTVRKVLLSPVFAAETLQKHLASRLGLPVVVLQLGDVMDYPHIPELRNPLRQTQCLQVIGGALRDEARA